MSRLDLALANAQQHLFLILAAVRRLSISRGVLIEGNSEMSCTSSRFDFVALPAAMKRYSTSDKQQGSRVICAMGRESSHGILGVYWSIGAIWEQVTLSVGWSVL